MKSPVFFVSSHNSSDCIYLIKSQGINVLINSGTPRKLSTLLLNIAEFGVVNFYPDVLPKYRGSCVVEWSIFNGDKIGNTAHFMDEGYDSGTIMEVDTIDWSAGDNYHQIRSDLYVRSGPLIASALNRISLGEINISTAQKQDNLLSQYCKPIEPENVQIVMQKIALK